MNRLCHHWFDLKSLRSAGYCQDSYKQEWLFSSQEEGFRTPWIILSVLGGVITSVPCKELQVGFNVPFQVDSAAAAGASNTNLFQKENINSFLEKLSSHLLPSCGFPRIPKEQVEQGGAFSLLLPHNSDCPVRYRSNENHTIQMSDPTPQQTTEPKEQTVTQPSVKSSSLDKKKERAARFGIDVVVTPKEKKQEEIDKKRQRAARFGATSPGKASIKSGKISRLPIDSAETEKIKKRSERFGLTPALHSGTKHPLSSDPQLVARANRFGIPTNTPAPAK